MCAIAGLLNFGHSVLSDGPGLVQEMTSLMKHRGPDDSGLWMSPDRDVVLGHRRLSILDLSEAGHQPMIGDRGTVVVFNGEIYNFQALRKALSGTPFRSTSDTEVILKSYEAHGEASILSLNGMFAIAIWDPNSRELLLARDRVGIKPLYFTSTNGVFAFASEIRALLSLPWVRATMDETALFHFLSLNHVVPPRTMFLNIQKLRPGYRLRVKMDGTVSNEPFWQPDWTTPFTGDEESLRHALLAELKESVERQMISDVPVGVFLSGGVDSSGLVALARSQSSRRLATFSVGFRNMPQYDELRFAAQVAKRFSTTHFEHLVDFDEIVDLLPKVVEAYDEPLADATSIPLYLISSLARANGTPVVLTGDGADELFCGYRRWVRQSRLSAWYRRYLRFPGWLRRGAEAAWRHLDDRSAIHDALRQAAEGQPGYCGAGGFRHGAKRAALDPAYWSRMVLNGNPLPHQDILEDYARTFQTPEARTDITWLCYHGFRDVVPNLYCHRADRMAMMHSVEARVPYLDNSIVEFAFRTPNALKICRSIPKYLLKRALEDVLPKELLYRRKVGFCVPVREWANKMFVPYIEQNISEFCRDTRLFDESGLRAQLRDTRDRSEAYAFGLWNLFFLMTWMRRWMLS